MPIVNAESLNVIDSYLVKMNKNELFCKYIKF